MMRRKSIAVDPKGLLRGLAKSQRRPQFPCCPFFAACVACLTVFVITFSIFGTAVSSVVFAVLSLVQGVAHPPGHDTEQQQCEYDMVIWLLVFGSAIWGMPLMCCFFAACAGCDDYHNAEEQGTAGVTPDGSEEAPSREANPGDNAIADTLHGDDDDDDDDDDDGSSLYSYSDSDGDGDGDASSASSSDQVVAPPNSSPEHAEEDPSCARVACLSVVYPLLIVTCLLPFFAFAWLCYGFHLDVTRGDEFETCNPGVFYWFHMATNVCFAFSMVMLGSYMLLPGMAVCSAYGASRASGGVDDGDIEMGDAGRRRRRRRRRRHRRGRPTAGGIPEQA